MKLMEYFMNQSIDMVSPPTVHPSEPTSPKIPLRLPPTLPHYTINMMRETSSTVQVH